MAPPYYTIIYFSREHEQKQRYERRKVDGVYGQLLENEAHFIY